MIECIECLVYVNEHANHNVSIIYGFSNFIYQCDNARKSHCDPIHPGTRVHYVGRRGRAGGVKE